MSENKSPEKKKPRRGLSISKTKKNESEKGTPSRSSSIISFFNNAPPAKLACPVCGVLVPRFGMNEHLDEVCQKDQREHGNDLILVEPVNAPSLESGFPTFSPKKSDAPLTQNAWDPETITSTSRSNCEENKPGVKQQASPYFKQDERNSHQDDLDVQTGKMVALRSLSSKLSKRCKRLNQTQSAKIGGVLPITTVQCEDNDSIDCGVLNGSQKENQFEENKQAAGIGKQKSESGNAGARQECGTPSLMPCAMDTLQMVHPSRKDLAKVPAPLEGIRSRKQINFTAIVSKLQGKILTHPESHKVESCDGSPAEALSNDDAVTDTDSEAGHQMDKCLTKGKMEVLPVEGPNDLGNYIIHDILQSFKDTDLQGEITENEDSAKGSLPDQSRQPYYLRNFLMVLKTIMDNEEDMSLFNEQDTSIISKFLQLSACSQKLYVRLFQRKLNWIKVNKIEYREIAFDLLPMIEELAQGGFLQTESELLDVSEVLDLLPAPELKNLAKTFHLDNPNGQKQQLVEGFLQLAKQRSIFSFGKNQPSIGAVILKRAKEVAERCVRVCRTPRAVFSRVLLLFSLTDAMEVEEAASGGQTQLSTVLMVNMGRTIFPTYAVNRQTKIFQDREDLIRYETAMHMLIDIAAAMANGNWEEAHRLYQCAKEAWNELKDHPHLSHHEKLPVYLRSFTVGWVYTKILSRGIEILQRLHLYEEAVDELERLLSQTIYCPDSRGRWWDRLTLNLHQHLKHTEKAIGYVLAGLTDPFVRTGHQLALYQRALRIRDSASCKKLRHLFQNLSVIAVEDVTHVTIKGRMFPQTGMGKSVFLLEEVCDGESGEDSTQSTVMCSVEELALAHYRRHGYDQGIHGEGSTFSTLYSLLMWDIIFMEGVPDVFRNSYQAFPLDLHTDSFFENRRIAIESRLQLLQEASTETLAQLIADVWNTQIGKAAALVSWERFTSLQQAQSLVSCFGGPFVSGVCRRLSKDLRHCRGGLPDLVVWNTQNSCFKLVEVKGPNDRLSHKQMVWLDELRKLGADVEVCHVVAIGAKSLRIS